MCLSAIDRMETVPRSRAIVAWKIFEEREGYLELPYYGRGEPYFSGKMYTARRERLKVWRRKYYMSGWHALATRQTAKKWISSHQFGIVREVLLWGRIVHGRQEGWRAVVGKYMEILPVKAAK